MLYTKKKLLLLFFAIITHVSFTQVVNEKSSTLHFICVTNTKEPKIGSMCYKDGRGMKTLFHVIANVLNANYNYIDVSDSLYNIQNVAAAFKSINTQKNDMIVFYYSGHGFSYDDAPMDSFPQIDLRRNPVQTEFKDSIALKQYWDTINANTYNIENIYKKLKKQKARFKLVLGDCCNAFIGASKPIYQFDGVMAYPYIFDTAVVKSFFHIKKNLLVCAAKKGEYAGCQTNLGSFFTYNFVDILVQNLYINKSTRLTNWKDIFTQIKTETNRFSYMNFNQPQTVIYKFE